MANLPEPLQALITSLGKLPGIGPRSAERVGLFLVQSDTAQVKQLADALMHAKESVHACTNCGALTQVQPCAICVDARRDVTLLCVIEKAVDVITLEKSGQYRGKFHVLGGKISPLNGIGPEDLRFEELFKRLKLEPIKEIILALPSDVEGDATSHYLAQTLRERGLKISRIAQGLPVGTGLEFADELTLTRALEGRVDFI